MIKREEGFTLIEMLVTMVVFVIAIAAASQMFINMLTQFKQQGRIAESNIEGIVGLELLRRDVGHAGYGLPWIMGGVAYLEAVNDANTAHNDTVYNDAAAGDPPRAFVSGNGDGINGSDVLVIKALNISTDDAAQRWTLLGYGDVKRDDLSGDTFIGTEQVIVVSPGSTDANSRTLKGTTTYSATGGLAPSNPDNKTEMFTIYAVDSANLRMPFNRADYYIRTPAANLPARCANGTGILYKATVSHATGGLTELPILDCAADMQVVYRLDTDGDGTIDTTTDNLAGFTAQQIRNVKEVRVFILTHEGRRDVRYTFSNFTGVTTCPTCIRVGESAVLGRDFDLAIIANFLNYRWKVYTIVAKTSNLRGK